MPGFTIRYALVRGAANDQGIRTLAGFGGGFMRVYAPDRPGAYQAALEQLPRERLPVFVAPGAGAAPLGFSPEEVSDVGERGIPFSDQTPLGDAIKIESIERVPESGRA